MVAIDLKDILRRTLSDGYGDLVTRRTGQVVRQAIERMLAQHEGAQLAVIDFATVRCLDLSCADEIVGRLLREHGGGRTFLLRNVSASHREALQFVLERHGLAIAIQDDSGVPDLLGLVPEPARRVFGIVAHSGGAAADEVARRLEWHEDAARAALDELLERRLVLVSAGAYRAPAAR